MSEPEWAERFREKVKKDAGPEYPPGCWLWTAGTKAPQPPALDGYGVLRIGKRLALAHRLAWELEHGREPTGHVCHHCDNPRCVNPAHLYEGDAAMNARDRMAHGAYASGRCKHGHVKRLNRFGKLVCDACNYAGVKRWRERHPEQARLVDRAAKRRGRAGGAGQGPAVSQEAD